MNEDLINRIKRNSIWGVTFTNIEKMDLDGDTTFDRAMWKWREIAMHLYKRKSKL